MLVRVCLWGLARVYVLSGGRVCLQIYVFQIAPEQVIKSCTNTLSTAEDHVPKSELQQAAVQGLRTALAKCVESHGSMQHIAMLKRHQDRNTPCFFVCRRPYMHYVFYVIS